MRDGEGTTSIRGRLRRGAGGWLAWDNPAGGGQMLGSPDAASWGSGRIDVFARGTDNPLYRTFWTGTNFSRFERQGGTLTAGPGAVSWGYGRIDIFALAPTGGIYHRYRA